MATSASGMAPWRLSWSATDAQEHLMLDLATGRLDHRRLTDWLRQHIKPLG